MDEFGEKEEGRRRSVAQLCELCQRCDKVSIIFSRDNMVDRLHLLRKESVLPPPTPRPRCGSLAYYDVLKRKHGVVNRSSLAANTSTKTIEAYHDDILLASPNFIVLSALLGKHGVLGRSKLAHTPPRVSGFVVDGDECGKPYTSK